jgi:hypothetical protein
MRHHPVDQRRFAHVGVSGEDGERSGTTQALALVWSPMSFSGSMPVCHTVSSGRSGKSSIV